MVIDFVVVVVVANMGLAMGAAPAMNLFSIVSCQVVFPQQYPFSLDLDTPLCCVVESKVWGQGRIRKGW